MRTLLVLIAAAVSACGQTPTTQTVSAQTQSRTYCKDVSACNRICDAMIARFAAGGVQMGASESQAVTECRLTEIDPDKPWLWPA